MSSVPSLLRRLTNPPILPIPARSSGNNVPHSLHKTRRTWRPNVARYSLPVNLLGGADAVEASGSSSAAGRGAAAGRVRRPEVQGVKMRARDLRSVDKAGGLEGLLHFTPHGRALRHALFERLLVERELMLAAEPLERLETAPDHTRIGAGAGEARPLVGAGPSGTQ